MSKKVLMIAYHYPPESNGGVQRPFAFAKYLKRFGYKVEVLTTDTFGCLDSEENIIRFPSFDGSLHAKKKIDKTFTILIKALRKALFQIGFLNIYHYIWYKTVLHNIDKIVSESKPDMVFATYSPLCNLKIGTYIRSKYGIPLITDFRDGFLFEGLHRFNFIQKILAKKLEREIVDESDAITTVSPPISQYFSNKYKKDNVYTIYNGFDTDDLKLISQNNKALDSGVFRLVHFGGIASSRKRDAKPLFEALRKMKSEGTLSNSNFEILFFGRILKKELNEIKKYQLTDIVKIKGYMDRIIGLSLMRSACSALLFYGDPGTKSIVSTKLLEYIFMDKPILGICKRNEAEKIIKETNTGIVTDFRAEDIEKAILEMITYNRFNPDYEKINGFSREKLSMELAQIIESITK
ncbi:MAG: glycosyltransferase [Bacillota bacterium]|nr:glycosyltransferase [Bacillota bacterium]